ncbi:hypothetical protein LBMAG22_05980 [Bacteroidota bacterium]|jgi:hypothetical protein|nr:hypothetical protein LBMAG22_05980 [Bacteroidota bacterium]
MKNEKMLDKDRISLKEFRQYIFYPVYPVSNLKDLKNKQMSESFPFWRRNGLMPFIPKGKHNVEISFAQVIWLRILDHLRALGYGVSDTAQLCDRLFKDAYLEELPKKRIKYHYDRLREKELAQTINEDERETLLRLSQMLEDSILLYGLKFEINFLTDLIIWCLDNNQEAGILVFPGGICMKRLGEEIHPLGNTSPDPAAPHIYLSIFYFLKEFIQSEDLGLIRIPGLLNENEKKVLAALNSKNISELTIKLSGGEVVRVDSKHFKQISGDDAKRIRLAIGLGQYEEVTLSVRGADSITFQKLKKSIYSGSPGK